MILISFLACGPQLTADTSAPDTSIDLMTELEAQLSGLFNSETQSINDPAYFNIQLHTCSVSAPELGEQVLYVEQAQTDTPEEPYRQRLYVLESIEDENGFKARSTIYSLKNPAWAIGLCSEERNALYGVDDITLREGCHVELSWNGLGFEGQTTGQNCVSSLGGASYATSQVSTTPTEILSWDQGFNEAGEQVWGAEAGAYIFERQD